MFDFIDIEGGWCLGEVFELLIFEFFVFLALVSIINLFCCVGDMDGVIEVVVVGGLLFYVFVLNVGILQDNFVFEGFGAGVYIIIVSDDFGQEIILFLVDLQEFDLLELFVGLLVNILVLEVLGGIVFYEYSLDGGVVFGLEFFFDGLFNVVYSIVVEDVNGCLVFFELEVNLL